MQNETHATKGLPLIASKTAQDDGLTVETTLGWLHGKKINGGKVRAFLGLPYAAAPVGDLRWRAPQPAAPWQGVRDATSFGAHCAQNHVFDDMIFPDPGPSEDCLFLNVYTPTEAAAESKLPVMVWIHGGGYVGGAGSEPRQNGDFLPTRGVVLVTINYRLGAFGFLTTTELAEEGDGAAGNYGLMDMIAALEWVKANITSFGGDTQNVTLFGESAGSFAVSTLMASPAASGLFHKAIGESGAAFHGVVALDPLEARIRKGDQWMDSLGVKSLKVLRALPTEQILEATREMGMSGFTPVIDGKLVIEPLEETYAAGRQAHMPLLAGWNRDEGSFFAGMNAEHWKDMAASLFKERAEECLRLYPGDTDQEAERSAIDYGSDAFIAFSTWKWIEAHRNKGQSPVYRYHFRLAAPPSKFHPGAFAFHCDEVEYVFGTLDTRPDAVWRPEDRTLSDQMMSYWTNFARSGDPNGPGLPEWPKYGRRDELIHLDSKIASGPDTLRPRYEFLQKGIPAFQF